MFEAELCKEERKKRENQRKKVYISVAAGPCVKLDLCKEKERKKRGNVREKRKDNE